MWPRVDGLRAFSFGSPGEMRQRLTALVLEGTKVSTAGLWQQDYVDEGEELDVVGERQVVIGDDEQPVATIELTRVEVVPFSEVTWEFADAEGEGFTSVEHWREGHRSHWSEAKGIEVDDTTPVVCCWFEVVERR